MANNQGKHSVSGLHVSTQMHPCVVILKHAHVYTPYTHAKGKKKVDFF